MLWRNYSSFNGYVEAEETADWFDADGTQVATGTTSFTPIAAGTYFVQARIDGTDCTSSPPNTEVTLTIIDLPTISISDTLCEASLDSYIVQFNTNATQVSASVGQLNDEGSGNYSISGIPSGTTVTINASNTVNGVSCSASEQVTFDCGCPVIANPTPATATTIAICSGDGFPTFTVEDEGFVINWYNEATGGDPITSGLSFQPNSAGTYYAEAVEPSTGCTSDERTAFVLIVNNAPILQLGEPVCDVEFGVYDVVVTSNGNVVSDIGEVINNGDGTFDIVGIPSGSTATITSTIAYDENTCVTIETVNRDCTCPFIEAPVAITSVDTAICAGEIIPSFGTQVPDGLSVNWYDAATGGNLLLSNALIITPTTSITYYAEASCG